MRAVEGLGGGRAAVQVHGAEYGAHRGRGGVRRRDADGGRGAGLRDAEFGPLGEVDRRVLGLPGGKVVEGRVGVAEERPAGRPGPPLLALQLAHVFGQHTRTGRVGVRVHRWPVLQQARINFAAGGASGFEAPFFAEGGESCGPDEGIEGRRQDPGWKPWIGAEQLLGGVVREQIVPEQRQRGVVELGMAVCCWVHQAFC